MQSVGYLLATTSPIILGLLFDLSANWSTALYFIIALALVQVFVALGAGSAKKVK